MTGYRLRARLLPIVATFRSLMMVTLTVDPSLFPSPSSAYIYLRERRCLGRTTQDLHRKGWLHSRRYFFVLEWQRTTEQVHFHVLLDASFIPFEGLLASWSKHRPWDAGPVVSDRPAFGTVLFSKRNFKDASHAANYATKYVVKYPASGFPSWVLGMGRERRVRRFGTSLGFWGTPSKPRRKPLRSRSQSMLTHAQRIAKCGQTVNLFHREPRVCHETGEVTFKRRWYANLDAPAKVLTRIKDGGDERRRFRVLEKSTAAGAHARLELAAGRRVRVLLRSDSAEGLVRR